MVCDDLASYPGPKIGPGGYCVRMRESTGQKLAGWWLSRGKNTEPKVYRVAEARESIPASRSPREREVIRSKYTNSPDFREWPLFFLHMRRQCVPGPLLGPGYEASDAL